MRTAILSTLSILLSAFLALDVSGSGHSPVPAQPLAEVPFTLHQNAVILEARINGRDPIRLLLDTGWGPLALVSTAAERLGLQPKGTSGELPRVDVRSLAIGGAIKRNVSFEVFPAAELAPLIGPHDGVLSTEFFRDLVLEIDYVAGVVRFYASSPVPNRPPKEADARATVPMVFSPRAGALPFTDSVFVDGKVARALFDTGGSGGFMAMKQLVDRASLEVLPDTGQKVAVGMLSNGQATQQRVRFARVGRITLGALVVESPRVMIAPSQLEGGDWGHDLNIGYGFMRNYVVTFDYPNKRITFERPSNFPAHWWTPVAREGAPQWEVLPQEAGPGEVILSKRHELGLLSNFAPTPFTFRGRRYASLEGFWQMMLYPESENDPRAKYPGLEWKYSREQVAGMTSFEAKKAGDLAEANMRKMNIDWVSFEGRRFVYRSSKPGEHYRLIATATREKVKQNAEVLKVLLATGDLVLRPDHHQEPDAPPEWRYFEILTQIRADLRKR